MPSVFKTVAESVLAITGQDAFFNGSTDITKIGIRHNVEWAGLDTPYESAKETQIFGTRVTIATVPGALNPKIGNTFELVETGEVFKLDVRVKENTSSQKFIVLKVS